MHARVWGSLIALCALGNGGAQAQGLHLIPGVDEIASDTIDDLAIADVDSPLPVIYYNPRMTRRFGPQLTEFFLAHEYGHIHLRHTRQGLDQFADEVRDSILRSQELDADCYAARRAGTNARAATEAALRFFTRLGPFRFDGEHPTGSQRAARILECMPDPGDLQPGNGETGVEVGPVSGEVQRVTFEVSTPTLSDTDRGREIVLWVDGQRVGRISNMRFPTSMAVDRFGAGLHNYRMEMDLFDRDAMLQYSPSGMVIGRGQLLVQNGDTFTVDWTPGSAPTLVRSDR
jgi:hypothetical protein